jgi:hypothetical protein
LRRLIDFWGDDEFYGDFSPATGDYAHPIL